MVALLLLFAWPVAEVFVAIKVADAIGVLATLLLLIAGWPIGMWALRSQGGAAWRRLGDAVATGRPPGREVLNGALVLLGGLLVMVPGFITDALGVLLLLPPTRAIARAALARNLQSRLVVRAARFGGRRRGNRAYDVDSSATDIDQPQLRP
jgi:UPF0716 protein FxsA